MEAAVKADSNLEFYYFYAIDGVFRVLSQGVEHARKELERYLIQPVTRHNSEGEDGGNSYTDVPYSVILFGDHDYRLDFKPVEIPYDEQKRQHHEILLQKGYPMGVVALLEVVKAQDLQELPVETPQQIESDPNQLKLF